MPYRQGKWHCTRCSCHFVQALFGLVAVPELGEIASNTGFSGLRDDIEHTQNDSRHFYTDAREHHSRS